MDSVGHDISLIMRQGLTAFRSTEQRASWKKKGRKEEEEEEEEEKERASSKRIYLQR